MSSTSSVRSLAIFSLPVIRPPSHHTAERKIFIDAQHLGDFIWPEERAFMHHLMMQRNSALLGTNWSADTSARTSFRPSRSLRCSTRRGSRRTSLFPPGLLPKICKIIRIKECAGVYEESNSSYRSKWFAVVKKDGAPLRVHSLEPLNRVAIRHSGVPPMIDQIAEHFAARACGALMHLYVA